MQKKIIIRLGIYVCAGFVILIILWKAITWSFERDPDESFGTYIESLKSPVKVKNILEDALVLENGKVIRLPYIKKLPVENDLFLKALENGIEIQENGEVIVLVEIQSPGNLVYRINLSELVGLIGRKYVEEEVQKNPNFQKLYMNEDSLIGFKLRHRDLYKLASVRRIYTKTKVLNSKEPILIDGPI